MWQPMSDAGQLWIVPVALAGLLLVAYAAAALSSALLARDAGSAPALSAPAREAARLLVRQRTTTPGADRVLSRIGIGLLPLAAVLALLVLPLGDRAIGDLSVGIVWFNAMEVLAWVAVWMVGWGSNSGWGLVGANRFLVQGLSYELPHMFALITAATAAGSLRMGDIATAQDSVWYVVIMPVAFVVFLISVSAFAFWGPFDQAVGRDIAGGAAVQLSGVDRLVFLSGRYLLLTVGAAMSVPLFLGGGAGPLLPGWAWLLVKTGVVLAALVWLGRRIPPIRMDRFAEFSWVVLVPAVILQALVVAVLVLMGVL